MKTFAQRQSQNCRLDQPRIQRAHGNYDIRAVDQFHTYCQAVARADKHCEATGQVRHASRPMLWAIIIAGASLCYYLLARLSQFAPLP